MKTITVQTSETYDILIERGILCKCGDILSETVKAKTFAVITDDIVDSLYSETVMNSLLNQGFNVVKFVFPHGEHSKSSETLNQIYNFLAENHITRSDCLIALGGGVVGDITGFAAATYLRGLDYVQIPTTLLAQIDSSVGGKTAIDLPCGKNLVGAFKQPKCVICDCDTLKTLSPEILSDGMAEAIKYGMIRDEKLFSLIASHNTSNVMEVIDEIVYTCIDIKRDVVEEDEFDKGERMILNFGHTIGHAIESFYHYEIYTHGSAVAIGMCIITEKAVKENTCDSQVLDRLLECCKAYNLPCDIPVSINKLVPLCFNDKKCEGNSINIILCPLIGKSIIKKLSSEEFKRFMGV